MPKYVEYWSESAATNEVAALVFAAYIGGLLPVLVFLGGVSDKLGRKPVLLGAMVCSLFATAIMCVWPGTATLVVARILQGIGVALCMGTCTAYLTELSPESLVIIPTYVGVASALGFGGGALLTAVTLMFFPGLTPLSYPAALALTFFGVVAVASFVPAVEPRRVSHGYFPAFPAGTRIPALSIAVAWAFSGTVISLVPIQLKEHGLEIWAGPALFLVNGAGVLSQLIARKMKPIVALQVGLVIIPLGYIVMVWGAWIGIVPLLLTGAAVGGASAYGFTYLGGLRMVVTAARDQQTRAVSGFFLFAYLGFGLPSILIGRVADHFGPLRALQAFAIVLLLSNAVIAGIIAVDRRIAAKRPRGT